MLVLPFLIAVISAAADPASEPATYSRPAIPPFEPASSFGRSRAQGDAETDHYRRPLTAPVSVDAYHRSYEYSPSDSETSYEQGVAQAQMDAQALMGGLDGAWQVMDAQGDVLSDLVVSDAGTDGRLEAAWSLSDARDVATTARRDGDAVVIEAGTGARTTRLRLTPTPEGWVGALAGTGQTLSVSLKPSNQS